MLTGSADLDALSAQLLAVVGKTMEATTASLWLRPPLERSGHPTRWRLPGCFTQAA
jgi:hypothetical protein